jgi:hypothetical protein
MTRVFIYLGRFAVIILGYVAAAFAASAFMHLLTLGAAGFSPQSEPLLITRSVMASVLIVALFTAYFAFIPSLPVVLAAEMLGRRDWLFYALGGIVVAAAALGMLWLANEPISGGLGLAEDAAQIDPALRDPTFLMFVAAGGIVGGIAYWLVAGRLAGNWRAKVRPAHRTSE